MATIARFMARCIEDLSKLGNITPVVFSDDTMLDDEMIEEGEGRGWNNHSPQWVGKEGKKDGLVSTLTRITSILPDGKPLWGEDGDQRSLARTARRIQMHGKR